MSIVVEIFPQCDFCDYINHDLHANTVARVRRSMKGDGWIKRHGKDMCVDCVDREARAKKENP